uniref:Dual specificity phosphatase n=1 Tax=Panagrolaimus davidi TaxID=227884 RepID=A0A914Q4W5_9BILA
MDLLSKLKAAKNKLSKVDTIVTKPDGSQIIENRDESGTFHKAEDLADEVVEVVEVPEKEEESEVKVSRRRQKRVERLHRFGFVVDLKPDLEVALVANGVYTSSQDVAQDFKLLKENGITHIINCATGIQNLFKKHFIYFNLELLDEPSSRIKTHFKSTNEFITTAIANGGKVLIHCNAGISRSCTIAIAYVMWSEKKKYFDAFQQVKTARSACRPNDGFMRQLREYEDELFRFSMCKAL